MFCSNCENCTEDCISLHDNQEQGYEYEIDGHQFVLACQLLLLTYAMTSLNSCPTCSPMVRGRRALPVGISSNNVAYRVTLANCFKSCIQCFFFAQFDSRSHV